MLLLLSIVVTTDARAERALDGVDRVIERTERILAARSGEERIRGIQDWLDAAEAAATPHLRNGFRPSATAREALYRLSATRAAALRLEPALVLEERLLKPRSFNLELANQFDRGGAQAGLELVVGELGRLARGSDPALQRKAIAVLGAALQGEAALGEETQLKALIRFASDDTRSEVRQAAIDLLVRYAAVIPVARDARGGQTQFVGVEGTEPFHAQLRSLLDSPRPALVSLGVLGARLAFADRRVSRPMQMGWQTQNDGPLARMLPRPARNAAERERAHMNEVRRSMGDLFERVFRIAADDTRSGEAAQGAIVRFVSAASDAHSWMMAPLAERLAATPDASLDPEWVRLARVAAAARLAGQPSAQVEPLLAQALRDPSAKVREAALEVVLEGALAIGQPFPFQIQLSSAQRFVPPTRELYEALLAVRASPTELERAYLAQGNPAAVLRRMDDHVRSLDRSGLPADRAWAVASWFYRKDFDDESLLRAIAVALDSREAPAARASAEEKLHALLGDNATLSRLLGMAGRSVEAAERIGRFLEPLARRGFFLKPQLFWILEARAPRVPPSATTDALEPLRVTAASNLAARFRWHEDAALALQRGYIRGRLPEDWQALRPDMMRPYYEEDLGSGRPEVRERAARFMAPLLDGDESLVRTFIDRSFTDSSPEVRHTLARVATEHLKTHPRRVVQLAQSLESIAPGVSRDRLAAFLTQRYPQHYEVTQGVRSTYSLIGTMPPHFEADFCSALLDGMSIWEAAREASRNTRTF